MKIKKISKKKEGLYEIILDNDDKINLYDDIILKYELLLTKKIDDKDILNILKENSYIECYHKALKYINIKLRVEKEIINKLKDYDKDAINYTLDRLKKEGLLNNNLYIKSYINDAINLKMVGPNKLIIDLKKLGFKEEDINNYLKTIDNNIWLEKIKKYINKKLNSNNNLSSNMLKLKLVEDLKNKGFYFEDINNVIKDFNFVDNKEIYEKEYQKQKKKLSKKYSGSELEYQIKMKMYQKGFKS